MKRTELKRGSVRLSAFTKSGGVGVSRSTIKSKKRGSMGKSSKQKEMDDKYHAIKKEYFNEEMLCTGCESNYNSTPSHLVPRSRNFNLIAEIKNIKPHCIVCHLKWESKQRVELLDYEENMKAVKEMDLSYYKILKSDELS